MNKKIELLVILIASTALIFAATSCSLIGEKEYFETRVPEESSVPFECDIETIKNIENTDSRFSDNVKEWIAECDTASTSSVSVFVLKYVESDGVYNYLVYRRDAERAFNTYTETLQNSKKETLNLCFADKTTNQEFLTDSLTFIRYVGTRDPELNILSYTEDGEEYLGFIIRNVQFKLI